jgi:hypothetical protein
MSTFATKHLAWTWFFPFLDCKIILEFFNPQFNHKFKIPIIKKKKDNKEKDRP